MTDDEGPPGTGSFGDERVGDVAEEATKLLTALRDWARESPIAREPHARLFDDLRAAGDHVGHGENCRYCPLCSIINRARNLDPAVKEHLAAAVSSLAQAVAVASRQSGGPSNSADGPSQPQRVDLDD